MYNELSNAAHIYACMQLIAVIDDSEHTIGWKFCRNIFGDLLQLQELAALL